MPTASNASRNEASTTPSSLTVVPAMSSTASLIFTSSLFFRWCRPPRLVAVDHRRERVLADRGGERHAASTRPVHDDHPVEHLAVPEPVVEALAVHAGPTAGDVGRVGAR